MKKSSVLKIVLFALLCICLTVGYINVGAMGKNPVKGCTIANISYVCSDNNGGKVVIDSSGYRVVHINSDNRVDLILDGESYAQDSFYFADMVACDDDGNIYIHSREASKESSFSVNSESIKKFSADGEYLETVAQLDHEQSVMKCSVIRMQSVGSTFYYFTVTPQGVEMNTPAQEAPVTFAYDKADDYVHDALYSERGSLYVLTFSGIIGSIDAQGSFTELYNAPSTNSLSVPWYMSLGVDGNLYVCDIGYRTIQRLTPNGSYSCYYYGYELTDSYDKETRYDNYIEYVADLSDGFLAVNSDELIEEADGEIIAGSSFDYSPSTTGGIVIFYICAVAAAIIAVYFLVLLVINLIRSNSPTVKMAAFVVSLTVGVAALFIALTFSNFNDRLLEEMHDREDSVALALDNTLPKDSFLALDELSAFNGEDYQAVKNCVDGLLLDENSNAGDLYCVLYSINDGVITTRYTLEEAYGINYPYDWDYDTTEADDDSDEEYIMKTGEKMFYSSLDNAEGNFMFILNPLHDDAGNIIGLIEIGTNLTAFSEANQSLIFDLLINIVVMSIVIIMIAIEIIALVNSRKRFKTALKEKDKRGISVSRISILRIVVFQIFFVTNITTGFLSYYALTLAQQGNGFLGLPAEIAAAFPISAEVLTGAIFSVFGSVFIKKLGRKGAGILGGFLFTAGLCVRFISVSLFMLTLGNAIQGCGWGIVLLIINTMIAEEQNETDVQNGFVGYNSALQNGMNSGIVFGGFLIQWITYRSVFVVVAVLSVIVLIFCAEYFTDEKLAAKSDSGEEQSGMSFFRFLARPKILLYFAGIVIPIISAGYYLNYLYPIIGEQIGLNETYIGYSYLLNGLAVICFGNILVTKLSKRLSRPALLLLASAVYLVAFALVGKFQNIPMLLLSLVILGISDSFGYATQTSYYSELSEVRAFGYSKAMGVYSLFENISQTAGSFLFGYVLVVGLEKGLLVFGAVILILAVIFFINASAGKLKKRGGAAAALPKE